MPHSLLDQALTLARQAGATAAEALYAESRDTSVNWRLGKVEELEGSSSARLGLRVLIGQQQAIASGSDLTPEGLRQLAEEATAMAKASPANPYARLASAAEYSTAIPDLDLLDSTPVQAAELLEQARRAEEAGRSAPGITNSEGASASHSRRHVALATSEGFEGSYRTSLHSLSLSLIAGEKDGMQRDYAYSMARHQNALKSPEIIGREAAERTLRRLNARKVKTCQVPVVFDPRVGRQLLGYLTSAINGASIARGTSFLKDRMGQAIFPEGITIWDEPQRPGGLASRPFDGEGIAGGKRALVENGILQSWLLDLTTAQQLNLTSTGHASRGAGSLPHPSATNAYIAPGKSSREVMLGSVTDGLYITETFGMGVNLVTGDYSQGAAGFWIEKGELAYPVQEITIAGHLGEMFGSLEAANDLCFETSFNTPTLRVAQMTVAGA